MRFLIVHPGPDFSVHDLGVFTGWAEALRELGHNVAVYNTNDRLIFYSSALIDTGEKDESGHPVVRQAMNQEQAFAASVQGMSHAVLTFWPDVILFVSAFFMTANVFSLLRARNFRIVILHTESPYQDDAQCERGQLADLNLLNDPANLAMFEALDVPAAYMPHAYRSSVHYPRRGPADPELAADLTFIGTAFGSRIEFFEQMKLDGLDVLLGGNDWGSIAGTSPLAPFVGSGLGNPDCVDNAQTAELYRHARAGINFYRRESEDAHAGDPAIALSPREIEMAACGLFYLRDPRPEGDEVLPMLPRFDGPEDASDQLRWWLAHDTQREEAARQARRAIANRTFVNNARRLLAMLGKL